MGRKARYLLFGIILLFLSGVAAAAQESSCEKYASEAIDAQQLKHDAASAERLFSAALNDRARCKDETLLAVTTNLGAIYAHRKRFREAEPLFRESLALAIKVKGEGHPDIPLYMSNLAIACSGTGKSDEAEVLFKKALSRLEETDGKDGRRLAPVLGSYARFLRKGHRSREADELERRAKEILSKPDRNTKTFDVDTGGAV
jgi:tetratricopeptide (TPR) repeat protein